MSDVAERAVERSAPFADKFVQWHALSTSHRTGELAAIFLLCPIFLGVALWNGFPLIFYDSGAYILEGLGHVFVAERAPVYSLLLQFTGAAYSLWLVAIFQSALTAFVVAEFVRAEVPETKLWRLVAIGCALCAVTSIGWYVGEIEPDCMTALVVLTLYLLAFRSDRLGPLRASLLIAVAALAVASHPAHLALAAGLVICVLLVRVVRFASGQFKLARPNVSRPVASLVLALILVLMSNYALTGKYFISRSGSVFAFARMLQDGMVKRVLDETCATAHYKLCAYRKNLPERADAFLWDADSPFNKLDRFNGPMSEYQTLVDESLLRYPVANIYAALRDTAIQFVKIRTGDQIEPQEWIIYSDLAHYVPRQMSAYMKARQQQGELRFGVLNAVHVTVSVLSLLGLAAILQFAIRRRDFESAALSAFVFLALFGNAFVCGVFSNPHDRYQSRIVWVPTFVVLATLPRYAPLVLAKFSRIRHLMRNG